MGWFPNLIVFKTNMINRCLPNCIHCTCPNTIVSHKCLGNIGLGLWSVYFVSVLFMQPIPEPQTLLVCLSHRRQLRTAQFSNLCSRFSILDSLFSIPAVSKFNETKWHLQLQYHLIGSSESESKVSSRMKISPTVESTGRTVCFSGSNAICCPIERQSLILS